MHMNMKSLLTLTLTLSAALAMHAQMTTFSAQPTGSKMKIDGSSTLKDWSMEGGIIAGAIELDSKFVSEPTKAQPGKIPAKVEVSIPVRTLKSGKTGMDNVAYQALNQTNYPKIQYSLTELTLKETPKDANGPFNFDSKGQLAIHGKTNAVTFPVTMTRSGNALKTSGTYKLKMSDYGIPPITPNIPLMGFVKTGDEVTLTFDWTTQQKQ
jgi:polyisoprenoid-binding protein YceI